MTVAFVPISVQTGTLSFNGVHWIVIKTPKTVYAMTSRVGNNIPTVTAQFAEELKTLEEIARSRNEQLSHKQISQANSGLLASVNTQAAAIWAQGGAILSKIGIVTNFVSNILFNQRLQKVLNILTWIGVLHNALMLSGNIAETLFDSIDMFVRVFGLNFSHTNKETGEEESIDLTELMRAYAYQFMEKIVGAQNMVNLKVSWMRANRIYQSAANVLDAITDLVDSTRQLAELTLGRIGKIGNALRRAGAVYENAYETFEEHISALWGGRRGLSRVFSALQKTEDAVEVVEAVAGATASTAGALLEMQESRQEFEREMSEAQAIQDQLEQRVKEESRVLIDVGAPDIERIQNGP